MQTIIMLMPIIKSRLNSHRSIAVIMLAIATLMLSPLQAYSGYDNATNEMLTDEANTDIDSELTADPIESFIQDYHFESALNVEHDNLWDRVRSGFGMPDIESEYTKKHENWYASRPDYMRRMLERSQKYLFHIVEEVEKRDMPTEIALLPMIESAYNPQAYSTSKASGIWQFVPATGKDFGLKQNYWTDKRRDVTAATKAALTYLQKLHGMFGSWDLALAAYNAGEGTVSRAIERNRKLGLPTDYQSLSLPDETKNYVPKLQAIKNIVFNPEQFGLTLNNIPNRPYFAKVIAPKQIDAKLAAQLAEISLEEFTALNPSFNRPVIIANSEVHQFLLPTWAADQFTENLANYDKPLSSWKTYTAKRGERIDYIAKKFNIEVSQLKQINNLSTNKKIASTRPLLVPNQDSHEVEINPAKMMDDIATASHSDDVELTKKNVISYKVRRGDTLSTLASRFGLSSSQIKQSNKIKANQLKVGQVIKLTTSSQTHAKRSTYTSSKQRYRTSAKSAKRISKSPRKTASRKVAKSSSRKSRSRFK